MMFSMTVKFCTSMKCWCTMPMPSAMASLGVLIETGLPPTLYLAAVGLVEAVEDRHQRRLAGAVLADDAVDGAALDDEIDVAIGPDSAETLVDPDELDGWRWSQLIFFIPSNLHPLSIHPPRGISQPTPLISPILRIV